MDITTNTTGPQRSYFKVALKIVQDLQNSNDLYQTVSNTNVYNTVANDLLHRVVSYGNEWMIRHLIELGADVDHEVNGITPLMVAIKKGNEELVEILLEVACNIEIINHLKMRTIPRIVPDMPSYKKYWAMKILLQAVKRSMSTLEKFTEKWIGYGCTLFDAALLGNIDVMKYMLDRAFDVNVKGPNSMTPLQAAIDLEDRKMVELLLENGADIDVLDIFGICALFYTIHSGKHNIMDILLKRGVNPNAVFDEMPILIWSIVMADYIVGQDARKKVKGWPIEDVKKCIELLFQHGADPQITDLRRRTVFHTIKQIQNKCEKDANDIVSVNLIIAHLAMLKMLGTRISKRVRIGMSLDARYQEYYRLCRRVLKVKIGESISLFELLTESDDKMKIYMRNKKFVSKLIRISHKQEFAVVYPYYFNTIKKRISRITREMRLKYFAVKAISTISKCNMPYMIAEEIIGYLDQQSLDKLVASAEVDKLLKQNTSIKNM